MNEKITLQDIVSLFSQKQGIGKKDADLIVRAMFDLIEEALKTENYVKIKGFGTFKLTEVDARESVNVNTGERFEIQGHSKISFTPDTAMKDLINKPFAHFETVILNDGVELEDTPTEVVADIPEVIKETPTKIEETAVVTKEIPVEAEENTIVETPATVVEEERSIVEDTPVTEETVKEEETPIETTEEETVVEEQTVAEPEPVAEYIPQETPVISEEKQTIIETEPKKKEKNITHILWGIIVALILIIIFGAYWMFLRPTEVSEGPSVPPVQEEAVVPITITEEVESHSDTLETIQFIQLSEEELRKERVPSLADTLDYQIVGTQEEYTLQKGETIIRASVKFFGTKKYWPYIVKHNMDVLKDPDNIPAGVQLKIPKLVINKQ